MNNYGLRVTVLLLGMFLSAAGCSEQPEMKAHKHQKNFLRDDTFIFLRTGPSLPSASQPWSLTLGSNGTFMDQNWVLDDGMLKEACESAGNGPVVVPIIQIYGPEEMTVQALIGALTRFARYWDGGPVYVTYGQVSKLGQSLSR